VIDRKGRVLAASGQVLRVRLQDDMQRTLLLFQLFHLRHDYTEAATIKGEIEEAIVQLRAEHDAPEAAGKAGEASEQALKKARKSALKELEKARSKREKKVRELVVIRP
jgi:hypothetical protein